MIILAMLVYAAFFEGAIVVWWMFVLGAMFDLAMVEQLFAGAGEA